MRGLVSGRDPGSTTECDDKRCVVLYRLFDGISCMLNARQSDEMQRWRLKAKGRKASSQGSRSEYEVRELKLRVTGYLSKVPCWKEGSQ